MTPAQQLAAAYAKPKRSKTRKPRADSEEVLQAKVRRFLELSLPPEIEWTASAAGVRVSAGVAGKMKGQGVRKGWPDLQFLFPDGVTRYIELKAERGVMSAEQRAFAQRCRPHNIFAVCRSEDAVQAKLIDWGVTLKGRLSA